jgi:WD40 repeat protein
MKTKTPIQAALKSLAAVALIFLSAHCIAGHQPFDPGAWEASGQGGIVTSVALSPDGNWIAAGCDDSTVKLWCATNYTMCSTLTATGLQTVTAVAFGPTNTIAAGYYDGSIRLWNTNGALLATFATATTKCSGKICSLAFSPNGADLAVGCGDWITRILNASTGSTLNNSGNGAVYSNGVVRCLAFSPDGTRLAVAGESTNLIKKIIVYTNSNWSSIATCLQGSNMLNSLTAPVSNSITSLAFSSDGTTLVTACLDQTICFWSTATWTLQRALTNNAAVTALAYAPGGQSIFTGDTNGTIKIWASSGATWSVTHSWTGHPGPVWSLACGIGGNTLVSGGDDHSVRVWQAANGTIVTNLTSHTAMTTRTVFSPDGSMIASAGNDGFLRLWSPQTGAPLTNALAAHTNQISALAFSPDATFLVSAGGCLDNDISVWSCSNGVLLHTNPILTIRSLFTNGVTALAVSPDTTLIASAGDRYEQVIKLWNRSTGSLVATYAGHTNGTAALAFSPNGQYLASSGMFYSGTIDLWEVANGTCPVTCAGSTCTVVSISFNPTGSLLASAGQTDGLVKVWSTATGALQTSLGGLAAGARAVAFSPDGTLLAAAGSDSIQIWQVSNWQSLWSLTNETVGINSLNFSPNGTYLIFGREDGTVGRIWNPEAAPVYLTLGATQAGKFTISNPSYSPYLTVQTSSNFASWNTLTNLAANTNVVQVADPAPPRLRFYRVSTPQ